MPQSYWDLLRSMNRWIERIYAETDFGRNVAVSGSGLIALAAYLVFADAVIAILTLIIVFPVLRVVATTLYEKSSVRTKRRLLIEKATAEYDRLGYAEKKALDMFMWKGALVLSWSEAHGTEAGYAAFEALVERGLVKNDEEAERFVLNTEMFDVANARMEEALGLD